MGAKGQLLNENNESLKSDALVFYFLLQVLIFFSYGRVKVKGNLRIKVKVSYVTINVFQHKQILCQKIVIEWINIWLAQLTYRFFHMTFFQCFPKCIICMLVKWINVVPEKITVHHNFSKSLYIWMHTGFRSVVQLFTGVFVETLIPWRHYIVLSKWLYTLALTES